MAYSNWKNSFWHTAPATGALHINEATLFVHPRKGTETSLKYKDLRVLERTDNLSVEWAAKVFPTVDERWLPEILRYVHTFLDDMRKNVYRYSGYKNPVVGLNGGQHDQRNADDGFGNEEEPGSLTSTRHL